VGQAGESEIAKHVVDSGCLGLFQPLNHHLGRSHQRRQAGVARVVAAVPVRLPVGPVLLTRRYVPVLVDGHPNQAVVALGP